MKTKCLLAVSFFLSCTSSKKITNEDNLNYFPKELKKVPALPAKENFYIFIMAGQSNMAGRGFVKPQDTLASLQVLTLDSNNDWVYAKEPLHYYEPERTGLDCGLSFAKNLSSLYRETITIGLVPCAVGGSSIQQWLGDSTYRNVKLYTNLMNKVKIASQQGTLKGLLWHQGESNANNAFMYQNYRHHLQTFFTKLRHDTGVPALPVYAGMLATFLSRKSNPFADSVNKDLLQLSTLMNNLYIVNTLDLSPRSDSIHFDTRSQRILGARFARKVYDTRK